VLLDRGTGASPRAHAAAATAVIARAGARRAGHQAPAIGLVTVRPRAGESLRALAARLRADPRVASVQAEHRYALRLAPDDPALAAPESGAPAGTTVEWWAARQNLPAAWDISQGENAVVAVVDTGIDGGHPEFAGRIKDTVDLDNQAGDGPPTVDEVGHGTHVASLACATAGNGIGLAGAGYRCSLLVVKTDLSDSSVAQAIVTATDRGADSINMSFGTDGTAPAADAVVKAIDYAYQRNVVMVAAAADDPVEEQGDPSNVLQPTGSGQDITAGKGLSITAANFNDQRAPFAGRGTQISMAAYGAYGVSGGPRGIFGAFPQATTELEAPPLTIPPTPACGCRTTFNGDNRYAYLQGTSMASPMVAAVAALMRRLNPALHASEIVRMLKETARRPAGAGWSPDLGWGILDGGAALAAARALDRTPPQSRLRAPATVRGRSFTLKWTGEDPAPPGLLASGIARYEVWRSANGRPARRIASTTATRLKVAARRGSRYAFFTVAVDKAGNREPQPTAPDAHTRVLRRR
jgi:subtilisin family serine protease